MATYPEKHFEAANMELNIEYLKQKIAAGAEYVITQMFLIIKNIFLMSQLAVLQELPYRLFPGLKFLNQPTKLIVCRAYFMLIYRMNWLRKF